MKAVTDISHAQGPVDFHRMADNHVDGVIVRAGIGDHADDRWATYVPAALAAGLEVGSYWFCNPKQSTPEKSGALHAQMHVDAGCTLPPMLDAETYTKEAGPLPVITGPKYAAWLRRNLAQLEHLAPFLYSNASFWDPNVGDASFGAYDLIVARYPFYNEAACAAHVPPLDARQWETWIMAATKARPVPPAGWTTWAGWQFSAGFNGRGAAYGVSSRDLDLNIIRDDVWARWLASQRPPSPAEPEHPIAAIPPGSPTNKETDMLIVNKVTRVVAGQSYGPGHVGVLLREDGSCRSITSQAEFNARSAGRALGDPDGLARDCGVSNEDLDALLAVKPAVPPAPNLDGLQLAISGSATAFVKGS